MPIITTRKGEEILVDQDDFDRYSKYTWFINSNGYAQRNEPRCNGRRNMPNMHREVLGLRYGDGSIVDHVNGNKLDNRKENLRICTASENTINTGLSTRNKTGYKGVSFCKRAKKFRAQISIDGKVKSLGYYDNPVDAHASYRQVAELIHGEFANFGRKD